MNNRFAALLLCIVSAALMSIPWLLPHTGAIALIAFVPLLLAEEIAVETKLKHFFWDYFLGFLLWNAITTFWVCNATIGGGIFAVIANSLQMSIVFALFRLSRKVFKTGVLPYIFLAALWIVWEKLYFSADISWPWLTLGNAFASSTELIQWYEYTGTLGGSLWIWICNIGIYGVLFSFLNGNWYTWNKVAKVSLVLGISLVIAGPLFVSKTIYNNYKFVNEAEVEVVIGQPNIDPYQKFESLNQSQQDKILVDLFSSKIDSTQSVLLIGPETFTSSIFVDDFSSNHSIQTFATMLNAYPKSSLLLGASAYTFMNQRVKPSDNAYEYGEGWLLSHNISFVMDKEKVSPNIHYKNKMVVGVEMTPYPRIFVPFDNWLYKLIFGSKGNFMGRMEGKGEAELHYFNDIPFGTAICYESVYGDYCRNYVLNGAKFMTIITNDSWWGKTPGRLQHFNYSRLRAIELRRDFARCGNTGISGIINQRGDVVSSGPWWERYTMSGTLNCNSKQTFFVRYGDLVGRISILISLLLLVLGLVKQIIRK